MHKNLFILSCVIFSGVVLAHGSKMELAAKSTTEALMQFQREEPGSVSRLFTASNVATQTTGEFLVSVKLQEFRYSCKEEHSPTGEDIIVCRKLP